MSDPLAPDLGTGPDDLPFAVPQPDPAPPGTPAGRRNADAQLAQAYADSYPADGTEPADGTIDAYRPGAGPQGWTG